MNRTAFLFLGLSLSASAFLSLGAGCGNGTTSTGTGGTGGHETTSSHSATTGTGGKGTGGGTAATLDCTSYCTEIMGNCTEANAQFTDMATCMGTCKGYPVGALADTSGDTLGCRIYHAGAAGKVAANQLIHCPHAGITGGDKDPMGTAGTCGEPCDAFCAVALVVCAGQPLEYADTSACMTECKTFKADTASYSTADAANNDMGCRMYHLTAASAGAAAAMTHCAHIHAVSPVCTM